MIDSENSNYNLYEVVYNYVLDLIFRQELSYDQKIPEELISQNLKISRTPIREALRKLESDGIVTILPKRFAKVVTITEEDMRQIGIVKLQLDFLTAQLAVLSGSNLDFQRLETINADMAEALRANDMYNALKKDLEFHTAYIAISGNALLSQVQSQIRLKIALYQSIKLKESPDMMHGSIQSHHDIIEALYSRDAENVLSVIVPHISSFYNIDANIYSFMLADFTPGRSHIPKKAKEVYASRK